MKKTLVTLAVLSSLALAGSGADLFKKCTACHGVNGEKKAMNVSKIIQAQDENKTIIALNGYKNGTYGGNMKMIMKAQVATLSDSNITTLAKYIKELKPKEIKK